MRSLSSGKDSELSLLIFVPEVSWFGPICAALSATIQCFALIVGCRGRNAAAKARQRLVQFMNLIGLAKDREFRRGILRRFAVPGGQQDWQPGVFLFQDACQRKPVHLAWHHDVAENEIDAIGGDFAEGCVDIRRPAYSVA